MKYNISSQNYSIELFEKNIGEINSVINEAFQIEEAIIILKQKDGVFLGKYLEGKCEFFENKKLLNREMFIDIRVFNKNRELYFWKSKEKIKGRYIYDSGEVKADCFIEKLLLWGTAKSIRETHFTLEEEKIKPIVVPFIEGVKEGSEIYLEIKNYLDKNSEDGVPYIKYWRAVGITK